MLYENLQAKEGGQEPGEERMRIETAIKKVKEEYDRAVNLEFVRDPIAYALFQVWKEADRSVKNEK